MTGRTQPRQLKPSRSGVVLRGELVNNVLLRGFRVLCVILLCDIEFDGNRSRRLFDGNGLHFGFERASDTIAAQVF